MPWGRRRAVPRWVGWRRVGPSPAARRRPAAGAAPWRLPPGASLHVSSEIADYYEGPYTRADETESGELLAVETNLDLGVAQFGRGTKIDEAGDVGQGRGDHGAHHGVGQVGLELVLGRENHPATGLARIDAQYRAHRHVDLARLAGLEPAAAIVEILNDDGSMARRPDLEKFALKHGIRVGTIADLIRYRLEKERNIERILERPVETGHGRFTMYCYDDHVNRAVHVALVKGKLEEVDTPLVRVHLQDTLGDVIGVQSRSLGWPLQNAIERIAGEKAAVIVLLRDQESSRDFMDAVEGLGKTADDLEQRRGGESVLKTYGVGAQILRDLGLSKIRVLSAPKHMYAISGFDLEIHVHRGAGVLGDRPLAVEILARQVLVVRGLTDAHKGTAGMVELDVAILLDDVVDIRGMPVDPHVGIPIRIEQHLVDLGIQEVG